MVWGSLVDCVPVFLVCLGFEYYVLTCLEICAACVVVLCVVCCVLGVR